MGPKLGQCWSKSDPMTLMGGSGIDNGGEDGTGWGEGSVGLGEEGEGGGLGEDFWCVTMLLLVSILSHDNNSVINAYNNSNQAVVGSVVREVDWDWDGCGRNLGGGGVDVG